MHLFISWDWSELKGKKFSFADILWHILKTILYWWLGKLWCPGRTKKILQEVVGAENLDDAVLEPRRESLRSRRRRAAYEEVVDELNSSDDDLDDWWCPIELNRLSHWSTSPPWVISSSWDEFCSKLSDRHLVQFSNITSDIFVHTLLQSRHNLSCKYE